MTETVDRLRNTEHYTFGFAPALCRSFLAAYRRALPLSARDLDQTAAAYDVKVRHDLWAYEAFYLEGNTRVGRFLLPPPSPSVAERWAALHRQL